MAYQRLYDRWSAEWPIIADEHADVALAEAAFPEAPVGSCILVADDDGSGGSAVYLKAPAGSFVKWG